MILVLAGTQDGREIAVRLAETGYDVLVSTVSEYGGFLARHPRLAIRVGALDSEGLEHLLKEYCITAIVDASHPYAVKVSENAIHAAAAAGCLYMRYERPAIPLPEYNKLYVVRDAAAAAQMAARLGRTVFLTTGSRTLAIFKTESALTSCRVIARVLPDPAVIADCLRLGFSPGDLVAMQGPFTFELNKAMFQAFAADVVVTKNSGEIGGVNTKLTAAMELGLSVVLIDRPRISYGQVFQSTEAVISCIKEACL
ncbi:MAG: precorrin-6A reductase [Negativicutes bacterium]|nr:precorrin-6A reductase [Negativicutes bacterium]